ncbi:MAG: hypothetical protein ABI885_25935 [Gammaproteobacteria bacterium]
MTNVRNEAQTELDTWLKREVVVREEALTGCIHRSGLISRTSWASANTTTSASTNPPARTFLRQRTASFSWLPAPHHGPLLPAAYRGNRSSGEPGGYESVGGRDFAATLRHLAEPLGNLPARCQQVIWLRRINELPRKQWPGVCASTKKALRST